MFNKKIFILSAILSLLMVIGPISFIINILVFDNIYIIGFIFIFIFTILFFFITNLLYNILTTGYNRKIYKNLIYYIFISLFIVLGVFLLLFFGGLL